MRVGAGLDLYHNRARFYDPQLGRFTSEDPDGTDAGDTNFYAFAWNNPKNWNDPSGKTAIIEYSCLTQLGAGNGVTAVTAAVEGLHWELYT